MMKNRNLKNELNMKGQNTQEPYKIDADMIKVMVNNRIDSAYEERKNIGMKSKKRAVSIAMVAVLLLGITAFAATGLISTWESHSSSVPDYVTLPTEQECIKEIGYAPVLIDTFENGYEFYEGSVVNNTLKDENNSTVEKFKSLNFRYIKDGDKVYFSSEKFDSSIESTGDVIATVGGTDIYYEGYTGKVVPSDYVMTEEDKKAEESGEFVFSYGSSEVEINEVQCVYWKMDGIRYSLMQINGNLTKEQLSDMAKEMIAR